MTQWLFACCLAVILFVLKRELALSAFLGGLICVLPNYYFARQMFTKRRTADPQMVLWSAYVAEFIKLTLVVILFLVVFMNYKELNPLTLVISYLVTQSCMWMVPLFSSKHTNRALKQTT